MNATIHHGDCLDVLRAMPDNSVEAVVCDPPYGLSNTTPDKVTDTIVRWATGDREAVPSTKSGFMGAEWDAFVPPPAVWDECFRVLKPGGHLLAFAGARTQDLMGISVRMAGFDIRDSISWNFGSGFPKSHDIGKAIDKARDEDAEPRRAVAAALREALSESGKSRKEIDLHFGTANVSQYWFSPERDARVPPPDKWPWVRDFLNLGSELDAEVWRLNGRKGTPGENWDKREVIGNGKSGKTYGMGGLRGIETSTGEFDVTKAHTPDAEKWQGWGTALKPSHEPIICARKPLSEKTVAANTLTWGTGGINVDATRIGPQPVVEPDPPFMYAAKAPKRERPSYTTEDGQTVQHSTVKPLSIMSWLVRLVTPEGGTVLDPFAGSGTTIEAALLEGFNVIGIERETAYLPLIQQRIDRAQDVLPMAS